MLKYILKRIATSIVVMWVASFLLYIGTINSGDPLAGLRENPDPEAQRMMEAKIQWMGLDLPWYERYWTWLTGIFQGDLGLDSTGVAVNQALASAMSATLRLVIIATLLAIVIGITVGILSAIRQYSGFDYAVTFFAFLFFSLPVFWAAVLLKEFGAIRFNAWIREPDLSPLAIVLISIGIGFLLQFVLGGTPKRRAITGVGAGLFSLAVLFLFTAIDWFRQPQMGIIVVTVVALAAAVLITGIVAGFEHRVMLYSGLATVGVGVIAYLVLGDYIANPSWLGLILMFLATIAISLTIGALMGGYARKTAMVITTVTGVVMSLLIGIDQVVGNWAEYVGDRGRRPVIGTIGSESPGYNGEFWGLFIDRGTQLLLPTTVLVLISIASYSRYTRSSMLEVLEQDYVRTARSKGLSERTVIVRHAFRNAMIPVTTIVAFDFASLVGGAVITERVFGWQGMGAMFQTGLQNVDPNPVMAFFLVTGTAAIVMNLVADLMYAVLDPRIRR